MKRAQRGNSTKQKRAHRSRPTPSWLKEQQDLDEVARRRCLMVLSVLSGELPVTDAITQAGISRGLYYQLEEKALRAMLRALAPGAAPEASNGADGLTRRLTELEDRLKKTEQEKRRAERLLFVTRKVVKVGPAKTQRGRPTSHSSTRPGTKRSTRSTEAANPPAPSSTTPSASTTGTVEP